MRHVLLNFVIATLLPACLVGQDQPPVTPRAAPQRGNFGGPGGGVIGGRGGFVPGPNTTIRESASGATGQPDTSSRSSLLSRSLPASRPLPTTAGKTITFEVVIAELYESVESPSLGDILALEKAGKLNYLNRLHLTTLEEQPGFVQFGALQARVSGRTTTGLSVVPIYNDINLGTIVQATGRVTTPPKAIERLMTNNTIRLKPGEPQTIGGYQATAGKETSKAWIVVAAYVGAEPAKQK
ncbi:MAG: hypothetical protein JF612_08030 [Planctomycetia bacterium]|nr:hypothetical protein [Planctomycetia bacterium]